MFLLDKLHVVKLIESHWIKMDKYFPGVYEIMVN